ncbi:MAG: pyridoxal-phosphate dependent enzyme [Gemmatimonadota bacterium]|nr:MAG: pyridoxal-phosphate dependent enzyme [Gemmatimonadota bacterium]
MSERHRRPYGDVLETIGWTPLIRLNRVTEGVRTPVYGKAEFFNPGGSVKDRIGVAIIEDAERRGELKPGGVIVEGTSGNTGVGLALAAALKGYRCIFTMPDKMSSEKVRLLKAFGAEVVITPTAVPPDHPDNYVMKAKTIVKQTPNAVLANQFYNQVNPEAHYRTTGPEIWEQTEGKVTHLVGGSGTGGTLSGAGRYLKERNPDVKVIVAEPEGSVYAEFARTQHVAEGHPYKVEGIGGDKIPETMHFDILDDFHSVSDRDAFQMARRLTREEGLFVGGSTGLIVTAALRVARKVDDPDACVVAILCDTGERYLSKVFNDEWLQENQLLEVEHVTAGTLLAAKPAGGPPLVIVAPAQTVREAINLMDTYDISQLPIVENGETVGSVDEASVMAQAIAHPSVLDLPVREVMESPYPVVEADVLLEQFSELLSRETPAVLVRDHGELAGIVTRYDVLHHVAGIR